MKVELNIRGSQLEEVLESLGRSGQTLDMVINIVDEQPTASAPQKSAPDFGDALEPIDDDKK